MMRNLQNITSDYLQKPTDFAVQIVGNWGYGKTYYYRKTLEPLISKTPIPTDSGKKYKPVYVSLFGLKSVEDIATKIVMDFYQSKYFKTYFSNSPIRKKLKITQSILKVGLRGFLNFKRLGNLNEYLTDIKTIGKNVLNTNELAICFDDLERKDTSLKIEDLTGYINSLVDENIKVIIISNDDLLLKNSKIYKNLKEKIIGITVEFVPDIKETIENIIKENYSSYPVFSKYLNENINDLINISKAINNNFRHIIYALNNLHNCYSKLKNDIIDCKDDIAEKLEIELRSISNLTVALSIEYKSSSLTYGDLGDYSVDFRFFSEMYSALNGSNDQKEKNKLRLFLEKYEIAQGMYHCYTSIFNYVTTFSEFDTLLFREEFKERFKLEKGKIMPQYELFNSLSYSNCFDLTDDDYRVKTLQLINYAEEGKFAAADYLSVMHYCERLNNMLDLDLEVVRDKLLSGLTKSIKNEAKTSGLNSLRFETSGAISKLSEVNSELYEAGLKEIKQLKEEKTKEMIQSIIDLLFNNASEFENKSITDNNFQYHLSFYSILKYIDIDAFVERLKEANNNTILSIKYFFEERYKNLEKFDDELGAFREIRSCLLDYKESLNGKGSNKIREYVINEFLKSQNKIIDSRSLNGK